MNSDNDCNRDHRTQTALLTEVRSTMTRISQELKSEMDRIGKLPVEALSVQERAAMLVGANQVLRHLEDHAKRVLNPPPNEIDFYDIPLMKLNQGITANQIRGIRRFISNLGNRFESTPSPINTTSD